MRQKYCHNLCCSSFLAPTGPQYYRTIGPHGTTHYHTSSYLNSTDEAPPGSHTKSHGGLAALLLHCSSLEVEDPAVVLVVGGAQLLPHLLLVLGVDVVVHARSEPVALGVVEDGGDAVRDVDNSSILTGNNE